MNARKLLREAAAEMIRKYPIETLSTKRILEAAEVSKQTFYRYYTDKYELANEIYAELTQEGIIQPERVHSLADWEEMYRRQFHAFRENLDFVRHLYSSKETGCTLDFEIESTIRFDREFLRRNGADVSDPRIMFAVRAKDIGGTWMMRDWILGGMQVSDEEMVARFRMILPGCLIQYYDLNNA